jgi:nucleoside phosphorylase
LLDFIEVQNLDEVTRVLNERAQTYGVPLSPPSPVVAMPPSIELPPLDIEPSLDSAVTEQRGVRKTPCAVVLTALPVEYKAVRALLVGLQEIEHRQGTIYERGRFARGGRVWDVVIGQIGQGNQRAASAAERAISRFEPEVAMFVGIAGGVKDVKLGDVVAATSVHGYEAGKAKAKEFLPRPDAGRSSFRMEERAKFEATRERWKELSTEAAHATAHVAPIAAGEKVVASNRSAVAKFLKKEYSHVLAVEMEGRGFLEATHANHLDAIVVRGISDLLSKKQESDTAGWQERAARNAAAFAMHILSRFSPPTLPFFVPPDGGDDSSDSGRSSSTEGGLLDREKIATEHDLAKRLSAALYKLTEARARLIVDLRQLDSASPLGGSLAAQAPAHAAAVDELVHLVEQLKVEARVVWGAQLAALVSKVQKGTNDLVRYVSAKLADDTFALIAYCTTDDEITYAGTAYSQRMDQLADLLQTWLGFLIRRESGERMSWETLAQRQQAIERETAELGAQEFNEAHDEYIEGTADAAAAYEEHCAAEQAERERFDAIELDPRKPEAPRIRRVTASSPAIASNQSEPDDV